MWACPWAAPDRRLAPDSRLRQLRRHRLPPAFFGRGETEEQAFALMDAAWEAGHHDVRHRRRLRRRPQRDVDRRWLRTKGAGVRDHIVLSTKTFNPMEPGRRPRSRAGAHQAAARDAASRGWASSASPSTWRTTRTPTSRSTRRSAPSTSSSRAGKVGAVGASNVDGAQLREALAARRDALRVGAELVLAARARGRARGAAARAAHGLGFTRSARWPAAG